MDEDIQAAAARLVRRLKEGGHSITVAESCTGGLLASAFTDIAGASNWFNQSWVTYSNDAKIAQLNVDENVITKRVQYLQKLQYKWHKVPYKMLALT